MADDGSDRSEKDSYYDADTDRDPDFSYPMAKAKIVEIYWATIGEEPTSLPDLYLDFHPFSRIEFSIFRDRLSAAILVARAAKKQMNQLEEHFKTQQQDGSHIVPGWEAESDDYLQENMGTVETVLVLMASMRNGFQ